MESVRAVIAASVENQNSVLTAKLVFVKEDTAAEILKSGTSLKVWMAKELGKDRESVEELVKEGQILHPFPSFVMEEGPGIPCDREEFRDFRARPRRPKG